MEDLSKTLRIRRKIVEKLRTKRKIRESRRKQFGEQQKNGNKIVE